MSDSNQRPSLEREKPHKFPPSRQRSRPEIPSKDAVAPCIQLQRRQTNISLSRRRRRRGCIRRQRGPHFWGDIDKPGETCRLDRADKRSAGKVDRHQHLFIPMSDAQNVNTLASSELRNHSSEPRLSALLERRNAIICL